MVSSTDGSARANRIAFGWCGPLNGSQVVNVDMYFNSAYVCGGEEDFIRLKR